MYKRKTRDQWIVYTHTVVGKEPVYYGENYRDARDRCKEYRANQPEFHHSVGLRREPITE